MTFTYAQVINFNNEMGQLKKMDSIVLHLLNSQIRYYQKHNMHKIVQVINELHVISMKFFVMDGNKIKMDGNKAVFKPDANQEEYQKLITEFKAKTIELKFA